MLPEGEAVPGNGRKRLSTDEEEDGNPNKRCRINEEEAGPMEIDGQNGNQGNNNGEEDKKEAETEKIERSGSNFNNQNSEQSKTGNQDSGNESGNQESGTEKSPTGNQDSRGEGGKEDEENDGNEEEERRRRAAEKGKRPMSCSLEPIVPVFSGEFQHGESSAAFEDQSYGDIDEHRDLAILRSMWNFKYNNGNLPHPPSDELLKYVMNSIPNYKLVKEYLKMKIMEFEHNFKDLIQMDGDNPFLRRQIDKEAFELCKRLWGNQPQQQHANQQQRLPGNQQQQLGDNLQQIALNGLVCYVVIILIFLRHT